MRQLKDFGALSPAEMRLRDEIGRDDNPDGVVEIGADRPGENAGPERQVRGAFLRYLMLGGCDALPAPVPQRGVRVRGARITGTLNLEGARCPRDLGLINCHLDSAPVLRSAEIDGVYLNGSALPGLVADRLTLRGDLMLRGVEGTGTVRLLGARLGGDLDCDGAVLSGGAEGVTLYADGLEARGRVFLRSGFRSEGTVRLLGAKVGGDLSCTGSVLTGGAEGVTLNADGLETRGGVYLRDGFRSEGTVRLLGARLGGNLSCIGAVLAAEDGNKSLIADGLEVTGSFFLRDGARVTGALDLTAARFGDINDTRDCWPGHGDLLLDRCRYGAFTGGPVDAAARIDWLSRQDPARWGEDFWPQPWEQCAKVLREMGHVDAARAVLIEKEQQQRAWRRSRIGARLAGARLRLRLERIGREDRGQLSADINVAYDAYDAPGDPRRGDVDAQLGRATGVAEQALGNKVPDLEAFRAAVAPRLERAQVRGVDAVMAARGAVVDAWMKLLVRRVSDAVLGVTVGYGRAPVRAVGWLAAFWLVGALLYGLAWGAAAFKPNNSFVLRAPEWAYCAPDYHDDSTDARLAARNQGTSQLQCFLDQPEAQGYPRFNAVIYSADTLLPIVAMEMQEYWIPDETRGLRGPLTRGFLWFQIAVGWALSLLAVAGFTGLIKSE